MDSIAASNTRWQSRCALFICCELAGHELAQLLSCRPAKHSAAGKMLVSHRTTSSSAAVARGTSSRVRPFSSAVNRSSRAQQKQQRLVAKAAEEEQPEAETEEVPEQAIAAEEFEFSFSEAKKVGRIDITARCSN